MVSCSPPLGLSRQSDDTYNVYRACSNDADGDATQITDFADAGADADGIENPRLSPDGTKILFQRASTITGYTEIWVVDATPGSTATQLVAEAGRYLMHPSWAPDNDTFVYVRGSSGGATSGGQIEKDTVSSPGSPTTIKAASAGFSPYRPQFNFDGSRVAYLWNKDIGTPDELRCMDADGSNDATVDTGVPWISNDPQQYGWARGSNQLCYSNNTNAYVINDDGTGKTQINANGDAAGVPLIVTADCWAPDDSHVVVTANLGNGYYDLIRAELDGSDTSRLNLSHGAANQTWMKGAYVYASRIWFIEVASSANGGKVASTLIDGTDYRVDLDVNADTILDWIGGGDGFVWN